MVVVVIVVLAVQLLHLNWLVLSSNFYRSCIQPTPVGLINYILQHHMQHLKFVVFKTDSTVESAQMACHILSSVRICETWCLMKLMGLGLLYNYRGCVTWNDFEKLFTLPSKVYLHLCSWEWTFWVREGTE